MSLAAGADNWIYVATRREILRLRDNNQDGQVDQEQSLLKLETPGDYPHNGLAGLTFAPDGRLVFGMGENLGEPYALIGSDGRTWRGEGEGGNIFNNRDIKRTNTSTCLAGNTFILINLGSICTGNTTATL